MADSSRDIWVVLGIVGFVVMTIWSGAPWRLLGLAIRLAVRTLKILVTVGLIAGCLISTQFYRAFGWTPVSLLIGEEIYEKELHRRAREADYLHSYSPRLQRRPLLNSSGGGQGHAP